MSKVIRISQRIVTGSNLKNIFHVGRIRIIQSFIKISKYNNSKLEKCIVYCCNLLSSIEKTAGGWKWLDITIIGGLEQSGDAWRT